MKYANAVYIFGFGGVLAVRQCVVRFRQPEQFMHVGYGYTQALEQPKRQAQERLADLFMRKREGGHA